MIIQLKSDLFTEAIKQKQFPRHLGGQRVILSNKFPSPKKTYEKRLKKALKYKIFPVKA